VRDRCGNRTTRYGHCLLLGFMLAFAASAQTISEYQVKAAFLYNFAKFVEWPAQTFKANKDPVRICVLGQNPFGSALVDAVGGKTVLGRPFVLSEIATAGQVTDCQIVFICSSERKRLRAILAELRTTGILTVGETDGFATEGGIVNFRLSDGRVHLEINIEAAGQAKLRINSSVLSLAQIVKTESRK
jgi:hypothetical protein